MVHRPDLQPLGVSCSNTRTHEDPLYYSSKCHVKFEKQTLHLQSDDFNFNMYPNVIGFPNMHLLGINISASLKIGSKKTCFNCFTFQTVKPHSGTRMLSKQSCFYYISTNIIIQIVELTFLRYLLLTTIDMLQFSKFIQSHRQW